MIVLGSTGSIGVNTLCIASKFNLSVETLVAGNNTTLLNEQIERFNPRYVVVGSKELVEKVNHPNCLYGKEGIVEALHMSNSSLVVNALVGYLGLEPTLEAIKLGKKVALANKESLVVAGQFVDKNFLTPIDSEHFGLWYLLQDKHIKSLNITASGGAFRDTPPQEIASKKLHDALQHPNWSMGEKITIDSATMVNKLFEILEAYWLFDTKNIDAFIETQSIIHALIHFSDGSTTAHIAHANMQLPIAYALLGRIDEPILKPVDLPQIGSLEFRTIDTQRYPIWQIKDFMLDNPHLGVVINAANEVAIEKFKTEKIAFGDIAKHILQTLKRYEKSSITSLEDIYAIDTEIRNRG